MRYRRFLIFAFVFLYALMALPMVPAEAGKAALQQGDFSYCGIHVGSVEQEVRQQLGEPLFDKSQRMQGVAVKVLCYDRGIDVALSVRTGRVVDIQVDLAKQKKQVLRDGVRYGATSAWLQRVYGKTRREWLEGEPFYIYSLPEKPYDRLLLRLDNSDYHLIQVRWTNLPLTQEEYEARAADHEPEMESMGDAVLADKEIDMSALKPVPEARWGGYQP